MSVTLAAFTAPLSHIALAQRSDFEVAADDEDPQCRRQREAALISGEIVVCAPRDNQEQFRVRSDEQASAEYAAATMNRGQGRKPDFQPPPCKPSLMTFCPKFGRAPQPAIEVDFAKLPEAPPGSDAARLGQEGPRP